KYPKNVYGCVGYWNPHYKVLSNETIVDKINISTKAAFNDSRTKYFKRNIWLDVQATVSLYYMLLPCSKIDDNFDHQTHGIIIDDGDNRATYLPAVFNNISSDDLVSNLSMKANITSKSYKLCYYNVEIDETT